MDPDVAPAEPRRSSRRWPLGGLTLLVVGVVAAGVILFAGDDPVDSGNPGLPTSGSGFPTTGDMAPDFTVTLLDGTEFRLSRHLADDGRPVILNLWASWCAPCRAEMPAIDAAARTHTDVYFLGVAVDDDAVAAIRFAEEIGVTYPLAIDESERVGRRYPTPGLPATFLIASDGAILRTVFGQIHEEQIADLIATYFGR